MSLASPIDLTLDVDEVDETDADTVVDDDEESTVASAPDLELVMENRRLKDRIAYLEAEALGAWDREEELREQLRVAERMLTPARRKRYQDEVNFDCDFDGRERKFHKS